MQNPPSGPPPSTPPPGPPPGSPPPGYSQGGQPPYQPGGYQPGYQQPAASSGIDKRTGAFLSYLLWWITGLIFLFVGKNDPDVKYHGAQSLVFFGGVSVINFVLNVIAGFSHALFFLGWIAGLIWLFAVIMWVVCMYKAWSGGGARFQIPIVGGFVSPYAEQIANSVT
ncbi:MAG: hypothetical protein M3Z97_10640 [Candidatus Dormibacteraeota bacterium]|nr:hypothetical protein [Candidatus Dormibacteraeota bacterium]